MTRFTLISAIYNVARYLPDFLESLDKQDFDHSRVQVVLVNDGSTDGSGELIDKWSTDYEVAIVHQSNAGQGAARNAGLDVATGEWVSFPDPDDILDPQYLSSVHASLEENPGTVMAATHLLDFWEGKGEIKDSHPLKFRFSGGTQMVDLDRFPRNIHMSAASAFVRTVEVEKIGLRFDSRIRPVFEDAHFVQRYLLEQPARLVTFIAEAHYLYRRRESGDSTLQTSAVHPGRYTDVLEFGLLDLLRRASDGDKLPRWLQFAVLYDLFWVLRSEDSLTSRTGALPVEVAERFEELVRTIRRHLTDEAIQTFDLIKVSSVQREVLLHGLKGTNWHWDFVQISDFDLARELMKLTYRFVGERPAEKLIFRGLEGEPMYAKTRMFKYLGRPLLQERILWISARGTVEFRLDGRTVPLRFEGPRQEQFAIRPAAVRRKFGGTRTKSGGRVRKVTLDDRLTSYLADTQYYREKFEGAWIYTDRVSAANDNAEHLYKYTRKQHPKRNAWFVVQKDSADWIRLKAEGVDRLLPFGSRLWKIACLNAEKLISSHIDVDVIMPFALSNGRRPQWNYVFLQHGVIKDDMSNWLNSKSPSLMLTATEPEYRSVVGDGSTYSFTGKEVVLTGQPRFDRLTQLDSRRSDGGMQYITVFPTWRKFLWTKLRSTGDIGDRETEELFLSSRYAREWLSFLRSPILQETARARGLGIRFMPHPSLEPFIDCIDLPDHIEIVRYHDRNVQDVIVETVLAVTDYSSIVFDAAFIDRHVLYFQFDQTETFGGEHIYRPGYFSYDDDGFGPVATTPDEAVTAVAELVAGTHPGIGEYAERRKRTFTLSRTENCKRAYRAILATTRKVSPTEGTTLHPTPEAQPTRYLDLSRIESETVDPQAAETARCESTAVASAPARESELLEEMSARRGDESVVDASAAHDPARESEEDAA